MFKLKPGETPEEMGRRLVAEVEEIEAAGGSVDDVICHTFPWGPPAGGDYDLEDEGLPLVGKIGIAACALITIIGALYGYWVLYHSYVR